jgi:hypothetical protein
VLLLRLLDGPGITDAVLASRKLGLIGQRRHASGPAQSLRAEAGTVAGAMKG